MATRNGSRPTKTKERVAPQDLTAEAHLLGAAMLSAEALDVAAGVPPREFYKPAHARIAEALGQLHTEGTAVDPVTIRHELDRAGTLEEAGGPQALVELMATCPATNNAGQYAQIVRDKAAARRLLAAAIEITDAVYEGSPADELVAKAQQLRPEPAQDSYDDVPDEPGHLVLDNVRDWLADHVAYSSTHHAGTVALWAAHTHALGRAWSTARLAFTSPEPESGKSRNLELLALVCRQARLVLQMSPASMYRWIDACSPTILLDEVDAVFGPKASNDHEDLRALINAGHRPGATVPRVETPSMKVVEFSAYCPVALAGLGNLPDTIRSRAIIIPMRRRAPDETVRPYRERITRPEGDYLRRRLAAWTHRHGASIPEAPQLPEGVTDRQADTWEPLIAIADAAGGHWPTTTRAACAAIVAEARGVDEQSLGIRLLADIHTAFGGADRITTSDLLDALHKLDEAPWGDLRGKPIDARWLARRLKPYGATPADHRFDTGIRKGYLATDFHDAWSRYQTKGNKSNKGNASTSDVADVAHVAHTRQNGNENLFNTESEPERSGAGE